MLLLRLARNASVLGVVQRRPPVSLRRRALSVRGASLPAADDGSYNTLASRVMVETEVKKSKFIAIAVPVRACLPVRVDVRSGSTVAAVSEQTGVADVRHTHFAPPGSASPAGRSRPRTPRWSLWPRSAIRPRGTTASHTRRVSGKCTCLRHTCWRNAQKGPL